MDYEVDIQNAQADFDELEAISTYFALGNYDLILAIATPSAQAMAAKTATIPILGTAITDYVGANLVESNENPNVNISGTSDSSPIDKQIDLLVQLVPDVKKVGIIYASSENNSVSQAEIVQEELAKRNIEVVVGAITSINDLLQTAQSVAKDVQVIYVPADNIVASDIPMLMSVCEPLKIPVVAGDYYLAEEGATASVSVNYYKLGAQTADMAYAVLVRGENINAMPIQAPKDCDFAFNQASLDAIGIKLPALARASGHR